jgi:starch phosphorylase
MSETVVNTNHSDQKNAPAPVPASNGRPADSAPRARTPFRLQITPDEFRDLLKRHIRYSIGQEWGTSLSTQSILLGVALALRDLMVDRMIETEKRYQKAQAKRVYYLSMEFLMGRSLGNNLINLGIYDMCRDALLEIGVDLEDIREEEIDAALGNGGLGRLAACFLDSLAALDMPGFGYGINYEYGLFRQEIQDGHQVERPDNWRRNPSPWLLERPGEAALIHIYGRLEEGTDRQGLSRPNWVETKSLVGVPADMPVVGFQGYTVNYLRLYSARASNEFDIQRFNEGQYVKAVEDRIASETISKVLYPSDAVEAGRELRLIQEYFFVACALRDIVRRYLKKNASFDNFASKVAIQLNDTHPALAVAELMRVLWDENNVPYDKAWEITRNTIAYTNHTLLPEALEKWPVDLMERVLPRHLSIIYEINKRHLESVAKFFPGEPDKLGTMSIIEESGGYKQVRMANLAVVGSHAVNGVAELHSELVKKTLLPEFYAMDPQKFSNKTNGVTPRRWLLKANPRLSNLLVKTIGDDWISDLDELRLLEPYALDVGLQQEFLSVKRANKVRLARFVKDETGIVIDPASMYDVISKRIHEYKRQLLMVMRVIHEYLCLIEDEVEPLVSRTYMFAGKAAPGYWAAKQIIKLINDVAQLVNNHPKVKDRIKVVFVPDYKVSVAEKVIPAADVSEQISTAGKEASGTSNMKFAMNGALTVCTWDGANIEIAEEVGLDNIFVFGLKAEEIQHHREHQTYNGWDYYRRSPAIKRLMDAFTNDHVIPGGHQYQWIFNSILNHGDQYFHLADFESYVGAQNLCGNEYRQPASWARKCLLNIARTGKFSSDRTIRQYADGIWNIQRIY